MKSNDNECFYIDTDSGNRQIQFERKTKLTATSAVCEEDFRLSFIKNGVVISRTFDEIYDLLSDETLQGEYQKVLNDEEV
mgnify:FL=1